MAVVVSEGIEERRSKQGGKAPKAPDPPQPSNVVNLLEYNEDEGIAYLVLEHVSGRSLVPSPPAMN